MNVHHREFGLSRSAFNSFHPSVAFHIEPSHSIYIANQITGFCMKLNAKLELVKKAEECSAFLILQQD